jgi:dolichol kinase
MPANTLSCQTLAEEMGELLASLDFARWRAELAADLRSRLERIRAQARELRARADQPPPVHGAVEQLVTALERCSPADDRAAAWESFSREVQPAYQALANSLSTDGARVRNLRPANYARSAFHALTGIFALAVIQLLPLWGIRTFAVGFALFSWTLEITRRRWSFVNELCMKVLGKFAHAHERYHVNSSTWYATALALMAVFFSSRANSVAVIVLGFGDPIAALIGRRFGRTRFKNGRSLEGAMAFVVAGALAALAALRICYGAESLTASLLAAVFGGVAGAAAELVSGAIDDNFAIPLAASAAAMLAALL